MYRFKVRHTTTQADRLALVGSSTDGVPLLRDPRFSPQAGMYVTSCADSFNVVDVLQGDPYCTASLPTARLY